MHSTKKIEDEFTPLPLSNQRKWQLRRKRDGLCVSCGKPAVTSHYCEFHNKKKLEYGIKSLKTNPLVRIAYREVAKAILNGTLIRQRCEVDNCDKMGESHHEDYSKPLEVRWLCKVHHNEAHGKFAYVKNQDERFVFSREEYLKRHAARERVRQARIRAEKKNQATS